MLMSENSQFPSMWGCKRNATITSEDQFFSVGNISFLTSNTVWDFDRNDNTEGIK